MRKHYLTISIAAFLFLTAFTSQSQIVISEIISTDMIELHNQSADTVNVDQYWLCNRPEYNRIGSLSAGCGNFNMPPDSYLVVTTNFAMSMTGDELGVYSSGDFADPASIVDYVIWGDRAGQTRESVAVSAGIWTVGDRAITIDSTSALIYDGEGDASSDFFLGASNQCEANASSCTSTMSFIKASNDTTVVSICVDDDVIEFVTAEVIGSSSGPNTAWVVTDTALNILSVDTSSIFDLESSGPGVCLIWFINFEDGLTGATVGSNAANLEGCFALSNSIEVIKLSGENCEGETPLCDVDGGSIVDQNGLTEATFCTLDDFVELVIGSVTGERGTNNTWVVTDTALNIISLDTTGNINLEGEGPGIYEIWHLSFEDDLTGATVGNNVADLGGCYDLSNSITLTIISECNTGGPDTCQVIGGSIVDEDGLTAVTLCADDTTEELVVVTLSGASGANSAYVVTDTSLNILSIEMSTNVFNLENASSGVCLIWHLSYEDDLTGATVGANAADLGGCFSLSNSITVTKETGCGSGEPTTCEVSGGSIVDQDGMTDRTLCTSDASEDLTIVSVTGASGTNSAFVVTDSSLNILIIESNTTVFSLESASADVCLVWHISYEDDLTGATVGANAADLGGCFSLSNAITVTKITNCGEGGEPTTCDVSGGSIVDQDGLTAASICVDDAGEDLNIVSLTGASGSNSAYVVTDTSLNILLIESNTSVFNLESLGAGVCLIWHLSYEDDLTGASIGANAADLGGCFSLSNSITVTRLAGGNCNTSVCEVVAGSLTLSDGSTSLDICVGDGVSDAFGVVIDSASGMNQTWVITDTAGVILGLPLEPPFDLEGTEAGTCLLWHLVSDGDITGATLDANANDITGCFALSNPITINRSSGDDCPAQPCEVAGGSISTGDNATEVSVCIDGAESEDIVVGLSGQSGTNSAWVVTDTSLNILEIDTSNVFNFDAAGAGVCLIWHISFEDDLVGVVVDSNAANLSGCFSLSNSITVTRLAGDDCPAPACDVAGGTISTGENETDISVCIDDAESEDIGVNLSGQSGTNSAWVVTDTSLNILEIVTSNVFNFDAAGAGVCLIWHISFEDDLVGAVVDSNAANLSGCFSLSNSITVTRLAGDDCPAPPCDVAGGTISTGDSATDISVCIDDAESEDIVVSLTGQSGTNSAWVVTDTSLNILEIDTNNVFNFDAAGAGVCLIWHISFEDDLVGAVVDSNAANLSGCFSLSNSITVTRLAGDDCPAPACDVAGGTISTGDNATDISVCIDDAESEDMVVSLSSQSGTNSAWVVTDTSLNILKIDTSNVFNFDAAGAGVCLIWHISFEDDLVGAVVDSNAANLSGCFALSNSITVTRLAGDDCPGAACEAAGGSLSTADGSTGVTLCNNDADAFGVNLTGAVGARNAWVITDTSGAILGFPLAPPFDLSNADVGTYLLWHLSYDGTIVGASLGSNANDLEGCFGLSNPITVTRSDVMASEILFADSTQTQSICVGDGVVDEISVISSGGQSASQSWVVTDTNGVILDLPASFPVDFESTGGGTCLIWLLNHGSDLSGATIGANANDLQGCFALSNPLTLIRSGVNGGSLHTDIGSSDVLICVGDGISDNLNLTLSGAVGQKAAYVVTDTAGVILETSGELDFDFEGAGPGVCLIWHLSYSDGTSGLAVGHTASNITGCFDLSNPVTLTRVTGDDCPPPCGAVGGRLETTDGETNITLCTDDSISDLFDLSVVGAVGDTIAFVVTDDLGNILGVNTDFEADFEGTGAGELLVRSISYNSGTVLPDVGGNINLLTGCYALSNIFTINRVEGPDCSSVCTAEAGVLSSDLGTEITICSDDGVEDEVSFLVSGFGGSNNIFVITDGAAEIIRLTEEASIDFEGTGSGTALVWHLSFEDGLSGLEEGANANDLEGCFDLSDPITVNRQIEGECPQDCATDGGTISSIEGDTDLIFCAGDVNFSVTHDHNSDDSTASYFYIITDEDGEIQDWQNSLDGGDFNLNRDPGGICRIYGYNTLDGQELEEGMNIADLGDNCGAVSSNFISVTKETGGACDEGCHVPRDIRIRNLNRNKWIVQWDRVDDARSYIVEVGYEGLPNSFSEVPIRRNRITLTGPSDRVIVLRVKAICGFGEESSYTELISLVSTNGARSNNSIGRSLDIQHGTVLPSGIIISEQAVAFPNPAHDHITVWYDGQEVEGRLSIFDQTGRKVINKTISGAQEFHNISVGGLSEGIYFIMIESEGEILMQDKLIKVND